ncbi:MAG TPA: GAF domain-containing protein [Desulfobacteria bacterium]|nr:GAF domain-containing protein [Desulfobacteria bacterium]
MKKAAEGENGTNVLKNDLPVSCERVSSERYQAFIENIEEGVYEVDLHGNFLYFNNAFCKVLGYPESEVKFQNFSKFMTPANAKTALETFKRIHQTGEGTSDLLWEFTTRSGEMRLIELSANLILNRDEKLVGFRGIARDVTDEKRIKRNTEALLRTSLALPEYSDLDHLLSYISGEIKSLLDAEGALVILLDEEESEFYFKSAAHDDPDTQNRAKEVRFPADKGVAGKVIRTGEPVLVKDVSNDPDYYSLVDVQAGFKTRNMLDVPLKSGDRTMGVICVINKKRGDFDETDIEVLNTLSGTVALSIENARFSNALKEAYKEVSSLSRAKDKVINHLSHELKTPVAVLGASLNILRKRLATVPESRWKPTMKRAKRNLDRLLQLQYEVEDIMEARHYDAHHLVSVLLEECIDVLESLVVEETGEGLGIERLRKRLNDIFLPKQDDPENIFLDRFVSDIIESIKMKSGHRNMEIITHHEPVPPIFLPVKVLEKIVGGLIKNAIENTPDGGKIEVNVQTIGESVELVVRDFGVGIMGDDQRRIFEGFWMTQDTMDYSSKREFDFNAGGKGADLLRMKIFSERYHFKIDMISTRCGWLKNEKTICPGEIGTCRHCETKDDCYRSGGSIFTVVFPSVQEST